MKKANRNYKDSVFCALFKDKEKLLKLYNAVSGSHYPKSTPVEIITLEEVLFGELKNDLAFIIDSRLIILVEHQSTINPNMPLRALCYLAKEYETLTYSKGIYSKRLIKIPTPELYVFYNGVEEAPLEQELKLSDAFTEKCDKLFVETVVKVINVNYDKGGEILKRCQDLREYSQLIHMIRQRMKEVENLSAAIRESVIACSKQGILQEFLQRNGGEVMSFLFDALTREECEAIREEDGYERGKLEGRREGKLQGMEEGKLQGMEEGKRLLLIQMVRVKCQKGKRVDQIAEELEVEPAQVEQIVDLIQEKTNSSSEEIADKIRNR